MDIYRVITQNMILSMQSGTAVWKKKWLGVKTAFNRISMTPYALTNQMMLGLPGEYATKPQWESLGGKLKRNPQKKKIISFSDSHGMYFYYVYHISQVNGVEPLDESEYPKPTMPSTDAQTLIKGCLQKDIDIKEEGGKACYVMTDGRLDHGTTDNPFYDVMICTLTDGKVKSRHNNLKPFSEICLAAEIGSSVLMNKFGICSGSTKGNAAYIMAWIKAMQMDPHCFVNAGTKAQKAVQKILQTEN